MAGGEPDGEVEGRPVGAGETSGPGTGQAGSGMLRPN